MPAIPTADIKAAAEVIITYMNTSNLPAEPPADRPAAQTIYRLLARDSQRSVRDPMGAIEGFLRYAKDGTARAAVIEACTLMADQFAQQIQAAQFHDNEYITGNWKHLVQLLGKDPKAFVGLSPLAEKSRNLLQDCIAAGDPAWRMKGAIIQVASDLDHRPWPLQQAYWFGIMNTPGGESAGFYHTLVKATDPRVHAQLKNWLTERLVQKVRLWANARSDSDNGPNFCRMLEDFDKEGVYDDKRERPIDEVITKVKTAIGPVAWPVFGNYIYSYIGDDGFWGRIIGELTKSAALPSRPEEKPAADKGQASDLN